MSGNDLWLPPSGRGRGSRKKKSRQPSQPESTPSGEPPIEELYSVGRVIEGFAPEDDLYEFECKVCTGCMAEGDEIDIPFTPEYMLGPKTPIDLFVHQDYVSKIHECKGTGVNRNVWVTKKIRVPASIAEKLKAHSSISPGPVVTDPEWRLYRDEPDQGAGEAGE